MLPVNTQNPNTRPFLKWAGSKFRLLDRIVPLLPPGKKLIEPFAGSAAVFLNTQYAHAILADSNPDLIHLYQTVQQHGENFIDHAARYFTPKYNNADSFYLLRERFNRCHKTSREKAVLFLYLNRHGYNGLCRYNSHYQFNVPFGRYTKPYFPVKELHYFHKKAQQAEFICDDFTHMMQKARPGDVVYCDPPYVPLSASSSFTRYSGMAFNESDQIVLANLAETLASRNIPVLLSNHNTPWIRKLYHAAEQNVFPVQRYISRNAQQRIAVSEILALFR
jgi:DNA adenine methylase